MGQSIVWYPNVPFTTGEVVGVGGLSPDGSTLVGDACCDPHGHYVGFICGPTNFRPIASGSSNGSGYALAVSNGGTYAATLVVDPVARARRWPDVDLGMLPGDTSCYPSGISGDGSVVVGTSYSSQSGHAFRWTQATGMVSLGTLPGATSSSAVAVTADGQVVIGTSGGRMFRWDGQMVDLGVAPGSISAINSDGSLIVGGATVGGQTVAYRWTAATGMQSLGTLPGTTSSGASGVSGDGSVVVGTCADTDPTHDVAFMWTAALGMVDLNVYLPSIGISIGPPHTYILYGAGGGGGT